MVKRMAVLALAAPFAAVTVSSAASTRPYLSTTKAKAVARAPTWKVDRNVQRVHVDWYSRWVSRQVDIGVTGSGSDSIYHSGCEDGYYEGCSSDGWTETHDSDCSGTVIVRMSRTGRISPRVTDRSCFYG
jgi:hypothetical protein